jgi:4-amino-4-deoxychorismate lyase
LWALAVFDTCNVIKYRAYGIDFHLDRLLKSAKLARITPRYTKSEMRTIILSTIAAAGRQEDVFVRFWLTAGRGDFWVSSRHTCGSNFLVVVHRMKSKKEIKQHGVSEYTVGVPLKPPLLATIKSNNYLLNALACEEAEAKGGFLGIQLDGQYLAEGSIGNVAILDKDGYLRTPPFEKVLAGTTVKRLWELAAPDLVEKGLVKGVRYDAISVQVCAQPCYTHART